MEQFFIGFEYSYQGYSISVHYNNNNFYYYLHYFKGAIGLIDSHENSTHHIRNIQRSKIKILLYKSIRSNAQGFSMPN
jgi:hypothetical protein